MKRITIKKAVAVFLSCVMAFFIYGCGDNEKKKELNNNATGNSGEAEVTIMIAAAASLENCYTEKLIPMFEEKYGNIKVEGTYDSSGKLQTQIENGLEADVFMSAATKQMNALVDEKMIDEASVVPLLENKLVLIVPKDSEPVFTGFTDIDKANIIAIGDPESVPAGQYAKEAFTSLSMWDKIEGKLSLGTNVTEVLSWVEAASADCGVVYATDAASSDKVKVIAEAPEGSLETPVIYPVAVLSNSAHSEEAKLFVEFLQTEEALAVFESYGFTVNK